MALIIGANDVVNPAARTDKTSMLFGDAKSVVGELARKLAGDSGH